MCSFNRCRGHNEANDLGIIFDSPYLLSAISSSSPSCGQSVLGNPLIKKKKKSKQKAKENPKKKTEKQKKITTKQNPFFCKAFSTMENKKLN